jgi:glycosyltransferase involved in cell wall biosynthesis
VLGSSQEGIANVLLEAMACGTPVVTTAAGGCPEVVTSPVAGVVVPERSSQALRDAIRSLWALKPDRGKTRLYAERFNWAETARKQAAVLQAAGAWRPSAFASLHVSSRPPRYWFDTQIPSKKTAD